MHLNELCVYVFEGGWGEDRWRTEVCVVMDFFCSTLTPTRVFSGSKMLPESQGMQDEGQGSQHRIRSLSEQTNERSVGVHTCTLRVVMGHAFHTEP